MLIVAERLALDELPATQARSFFMVLVSYWPIADVISMKRRRLLRPGIRISFIPRFHPYSVFLSLRHSHGGTGSLSAHNPLRCSLASASS